MIRLILTFFLLKFFFYIYMKNSYKPSKPGKVWFKENLDRLQKIDKFKNPKKHKSAAGNKMSLLLRRQPNPENESSLIHVRHLLLQSGGMDDLSSGVTDIRRIHPQRRLRLSQVATKPPWFDSPWNMHDPRHPLHTQSKPLNCRRQLLQWTRRGYLLWWLNIWQSPDLLPSSSGPNLVTHPPASTFSIAAMVMASFSPLRFLHTSTPPKMKKLHHRPILIHTLAMKLLNKEGTSPDTDDGTGVEASTSAENPFLARKREIRQRLESCQLRRLKYVTHLSYHRIR